MQHQGQVNAVAFSPDGKTVLTGSSDKTARLWDAATGRPIGQPIAASRRGQCRGVQPRRQDRRHRESGDQARRGSGTPPPVAHRRSHWSIKAWSMPWRSAPTARPSSPGAATRRRGSGTPPPAGPSASLKHRRRGLCRGVQPRRQDRPHRELSTRRRGSGTPPPAGPSARH